MTQFPIKPRRAPLGASSGGMTLTLALAAAVSLVSPGGVQAQGGDPHAEAVGRDHDFAHRAREWWSW